MFLPIVFLLYWFVFKSLRWQNLFVVAASYLFYGWWDWRFLILIAITTLCSFASGLLLERLEGQRMKQKWVSAANIAFNLLILCAFKYYNFFWREPGCLVQGFRHAAGLGYLRHSLACRYQLLYLSGIELYH